MLVQLLFGLVLVITANADNERMDFSDMQGPVEITSPGGNWTPIEEIDDIRAADDSSEDGVTPGKLATTCKCGWANRSGRRIVNGRLHGPHEYPWIVGVAAGHMPNRPHCGGTIISLWHVLTAAHCTDGYISLVVTAGDYDRTGYKVSVTYRVKKIIDHQNYNKVILKHDISLLVLATSVQESNTIGIACLPRSNQNMDRKKVRFIGWGAIKYQGPMTDLPQKTDLFVVDIHTCSLAWPHHITTFPQTQICTYAKGTTPCQGDSGGPVVYLDPLTNRYTLVALVSFGPWCADVPIPSVQTSVAHYLEWIKKNIEATTPGQQTCS
uniref:Venom S1 protease 40 n=1 Tax=Ectomocoris sp. TaxID=3104572 RepID=A0AB38ZEF3_9HEMI